jgi:RHS repeat-associated protein
MKTSAMSRLPFPERKSCLNSKVPFSSACLRGFLLTLLVLTGAAARTAGAAYTQVTTLAHGPELSEPYGVALLPSGDLIVADAGHHRIVRVSITGVVTVVAGNGELGDRDGAAAQAQFKRPVAVAYDAARDLIYVADTQSDSIRRIAGGTVSTFAATGFSDPMGLTLDSAGNLYVADSGNNRIKKITVAGTVTTVAGTGQVGNLDHAQALQAKFNQPNGLVFAASGALYIADQKNHLIRKLENGAVTTVAGNSTNGWVDGPALSAKFREPRALVFDATGGLLIADSNNNLVRRLTLGAGAAVSTIAGTGTVGYVDGPVATAKFRETAGLVFAGAIYVCDPSNDAIRVIGDGGSGSPAPVVTVQENGVAFPDNALLNHNATPTVTVTGVSSYTIDAKVDGQPYTIGTPVTVENVVHTLDVAVTSGGVTTTVPTIHFRIDKTAPLVTVTESGSVLAGAAFDHTIAPVVTVLDASTFTIAASLDGSLWTSGTAIAAEGAHVLQVSVTDAAQWTTPVPPIAFVIDKTAPVVRILESGIVLQSGRTFNRPVQPVVDIVDLTTPTTTATLDGQVWTSGTAISQDGLHTLVVSVEDRVHHVTPVAPIQFTIDRTAPILAFTSPIANAVLAAGEVLVTGTAGDAVSVTVNGVSAEVDLVAKTFKVSALRLLEGPNTIVAIGTDAAGNVSSPVSVDVTVDTRAPEVTIVAPAANACLTTREVAVHGAITDPNVASVKVAIVPGTATPVDATLSTDHRSWNATLQFPAEGKFVIAVTARDDGGHESVATVQVRIDQTKPRIEITESGSPFTALFVNHTVAPFVRVIDADPDAALTVTLDGAPYVSGTPIASEKNFAEYELKATSADCAGNHADDVIVRFVIDKTVPQFLTLSPANDASIGASPAVGGTVSPDTASVFVEGSHTAATVSNGTFTFGALPIADGVNRFTLVAVDRAGNTTRLDYSFTLKTSAPAVEIVENGSLIVSGTRYNREVTVDIRSNEAGAVITATRNGQPFTSGTTITENGSHTIHATARDSFGHTSAAGEVTFTIDRERPVVSITEPVDGAAVSTDRVRVRGTITGDPVSSTINGAALPLVNGAFDAEVALAVGVNQITITALDAAGNAGSASVDVTRGGGTLGLILTSPVDGAPTNRRTTTVAGQVLSPAGVDHVTVNGIDVAIDAAGAFRKTDFTLVEGQNTITAIVRKNGAEGSVSVTVPADFTAPAVTVRESGHALEEEARFATRADLTVSATDGGQSVTPALLIDAVTTASPVAVTAAGGHTLVATARDAAGNEARVERTFFIGGNGGGGCALTDFDPISGSLVTANSITLVGRTGGAVGVKVNGSAANVSNGSFSANVNLPAEGANTVTIQCTDAAGNDTGTPATITLTRVTGAPSVDITTPADNSVTANETVTVSGTVANATQVLINGAAATVTGNTFTASNVRLASGVNVIVARAVNAAGRTSTDSARVTWLKTLPAIAITSPAAAFTARTAAIDISGTWTNLDPASLTVTSGSTAAQSQTTVTSDTAGTFKAASVPLTTGLQTITVRGLDRLGRSTTATIAITRTDGKPSITITEPADNAYFGSIAGATFTVRGAFDAEAGATVEVNGQSAVIDAATATYTATVPFTTFTTTPVVARVTEPSGTSSLDSIRVNKLGAAPAVTQTFPEADAVNADAGTLPLVLFSAPMDRASVRSAFRLENAAGSAVSGDITLDRDVLTFAPAVLLEAGERYTIRLAASAADLAGNTIAAAFTSSFTVAATAPAVAPSLAATATRACDSIDLNGTAPAGAHVRIELGTLSFNVTASTSDAFTFRLPLSGRSGFQVARVRIVGTDGSLSPAAEAHFEVDCAGPQVMSATYDRNANAITVSFSKPIDLATVTTGANGSARIQLTDGTVAGGTVTALSAPSSVSITPAQDLGAVSFTLTITTAVKDTNGAALTAPYTRAFAFGEPALGDGTGYIAGEIFDADTGRPLPGATVSIDVPAGAFVRGIATNEISTTSTVTGITDNRGRYLRELPEGAHTIRASANGYTTVWRQIIVRTGAGVTPTDIRLTPRGPAKNGNGGALVLTHGGVPGSPLSLPAELRVPAAMVATGQSVTLTSVGAQSLAGLLPLGWSPLASAEIVSNAASLSGAELIFTVPGQTITNAGQTLTAVRYYDDRDEWRVISAVVPVAADKATVPVAAAGSYALVYRDVDPRLAKPADPAGGAALNGVADPCLEETTPCAPLAAKEALHLEPPVVLPTQRTVATLRIEGAGASRFPSGTAVQAYVDEELRLADGTRDVVAPFATDLLLYRNLTGDTGEAVFHLAPSARASEVVLEVGYDHIRILPYPERLDRGALIGPEGGRVAGDDRVAVEIPAGATTEALKAAATSITDFASFGTIAGYRIVGGLSLSLEWAAEGTESSPVELTKPARATFTVTGQSLPSQLILVEVLEGTPYGRLFRLAAQISALEGGTRFTTKTIDRAVLPVDGIVREGRYLLLAPDAPIAFATGTVHLGLNGPATANARVLTPTLGVVDLTRITGIFNVPVPAALFSLVPRTVATGDGAPYNHPTAPAVDTVVHVGALSIVSQPPTVAMTVFAHHDSGLVEVTADGATGVAPTTSVKASFSPGLDPQSVRTDSITVIDDGSAAVVPGHAVAQGGTAILWTLEPGTRLNADSTYTAVVSSNVRSTNGTPLGISRSATFSTVSALTSPDVDPSKIRITMPDATGHSQIIGTPGALKEHWNAVAVRRGRDFSNRPQDTADAQRAFLIELGTGNDPNNRVTIADVIYLQIINDAGSVAAIVPLGPFTTEDGRGFVARADVDTRYTTPDNITLAVPAGAFDVPTIVRVDPAPKSAITGVPGFDEELKFLAGFKIDFEGKAKKKLDITFPMPANLGANERPFLGHYGMSSQGPRIMLSDLLRRDGATLTTYHPPDDSNARGLSVQGVAGQAIIRPNILRDMLMGIDQPSIAIGFAFQTSINFITFAPPPVPMEFFVPPVKSIYFSTFLAETDRILVPVAANGAFNIVGIDPGSGLEVFNAAYTALAPGEPESATPVTLPSTNDHGPYPVFASPGRTEILDIHSDDFTDESIRNIKAVYNGSAVDFSNGATPLPANTHVEIVNVRSGASVSSDNFAGLTISALRGDRLIVLISDHDVDPNVNVTVVFSEPIEIGTIDDLRAHFKLLARDASVPGSTFQPVPGLLDIEDNSGGRRISVINRAGFQRGKTYRLLLSKDIEDVDPGFQLKLAQGASGTPPAAGPELSDDLHIDFSIRAPKGLVDSFDLSAGSVRDLAMIGNVLFVSALEGGIFAYDTSNPMAMGSSPAFARVAPPIGNDGQNWALASDVHGRLYTTATTAIYGVVRSYRMEDFECGVTNSCANPLPVTSPPGTPPGTPPNVQKGNAIIAWRTGINAGLPLSSWFIGGWPEAIPRKMKVVTRDSEPEVNTFENLVSGATDAGNGFRTGTLTLTSTGGLPYDKQRVTVINVTRDYRWSADVDMGGSTDVTVIGQPSDELRIIRNLSTIGVVSLFGFGIGTYDLNAIDANYRHIFDSSWERLEDTYVLNDGEANDAGACDKATQAQAGRSCEIGSLAFSPDAALAVKGETVSILVLEQNRGLLHLTMSPSAVPGQAASFGRPGSMIFAEKVGPGRFGHPRINQLRRLYATAAGREPTSRYATVDTFQRGGTTYALVSGFEIGLMVVKLDPAMTASSLVDVVWIPSGAQSVRVAESQDLAVVVDGKGRVLLVNLAGLDESSRMAPVSPCTNINCEWPLFPSALAAIKGASAGPGEVGADDPRIVWKSPDPLPPDADGVVRPLVFGTLAPWFDSDTGFLYAGSVLQTKMRVVSAVDPHVRFVGQTGLGAVPSSMKQLDRIVPLGIKPPDGSVAGVNGSLGAFRMQVLLPGSVEESLAGPPHIEIETENILGVASPQTPDPLPRSRFRQAGPRPVNGFELIHDAPDTVSDVVKKLRYQRGWNRMTTPWIVAIADPRASKDYVWPSGTTSAKKAEEGCFACERPEQLKDRPEPEVFELFTAGRYINAHPTTTDLTGDWNWLGQSRRLDARINTIPADTVRPIPVLVAAQAPPVAGGMLQETTYVHSGEIETSAIDFDAGGRAGWNVVFDRTYRSRTLYESPLGAGWDSSIFRRLRHLPNGDVEYRDGAEVWTFKYSGGTYTSPAGLAFSLKRIDRGWTVVDQKYRITTFDELGRLIRESDEFFNAADPTGTGNVIHYGYDGDGRLVSITDPVGRKSTLTYYAAATPQGGLVEEITDWHDTPRKIKFHYDNDRRLTKVQLPDVVNTSSSRPEVKYGYVAAGGTFNDKIELRTNLETITDPGETTSRVKFEYGASGLDRDHVKKQTWGTNETATMSYASATSATVTDILGQERKYTLTENSATDVIADRAHATEMHELQVPVWSGAPFGRLPATVTAGEPSNAPTQRVWTYTYTDGMQTGTSLDGVSSTTIGYNSAPGGAGKLVASLSSTGSSPPSGVPWMPLDTSIQQTFEYQSGPNASSFLKAVTTGSKRIESPEPHRGNVAPSASNDSINATNNYDKNGLFKESVSSGGTDTGGSGSKSKIEYWPASAQKHARFLPHFIKTGEGVAELITEITYPTDTQIVERDARGVETTTDFDTWQRPKSVRVIKPAEPLAIETHYQYDALGRVKHVLQLQDGQPVLTSYTYDLMGRILTTTTNNVATVGSVTTSIEYVLANRKTVTTQPGGAKTTSVVDPLGRPISSTLNTGSSPIEQRFAYDLGGNRAYTTDLFIASATAYDSHGRAIATRGADGTISTMKLDENGQATEVKTLDPSANEIVSESSYQYSQGGRMESMKAKVDASTDRSTSTVWDGGGRTTGTATGNRASRSTYDVAGRSVLHEAGAGSATALSEIFSKSEITAFSGDLPATTSSSEKAGPQIATTVEHDTTGNVTRANTGSLEWKQTYDELGNLTEASAPGRPPTKWDVDSRGAVKEETLPGGAKNQYAYEGTGAQTNYNDPKPEATNTVTDLIGRPTSRTYPDGTSETITWEGSRLGSVTDRQGRTQSYLYNSKGQLEEIRSGTTVLDHLTYDTAGRMASWKTPDSEVTWAGFDLEGRPRVTMQRRFKNGTGLTSQQILDEFSQLHLYNEHGERTFATMPSYPTLTLGAGWTKGIAEQRDAMGNITSISRADAPGAIGAAVMTASYRNAGRPDSRTVSTAGGSSLVRIYTYSTTTGQIESLSVTNANGVIAGSEVKYDGVQKSSARLLGLASGERYQHWSYDGRSRVAASLYGVTDPNADPSLSLAGRAKEDLSPADFRNAQERVSALDVDTRDKLAQKNVDTTKIDPPTASFTEQSGHKIAEVTKGPQVRPFGYQGAERVDDGRFTYEFDVKGRLIRATQKATVGPIRSIAYTYSGAGRMVGRRAEYSSSATTPAWQIEDRPQILNLDGLPADTTFVWDPITDRLVSVFKAGATATTDAHGGLLKQVIHGGASYDDPLETATIDPANGAVTHLYPIYDEAGSGSLQAIVNTNGEVIARNLSRDPYGADDVALSGAAVDSVKVEVKKNAAVIETVTVTLHSTEELSESTIGTGARLATVDKDGLLVRTTGVAPIRVGADTPTPDDDDKFALRWTLTAVEWATLTDPTPITIGGRTPVDLSVAAKDTLRATNWSSDLPLLPPPTWVQASKSVFTSGTLPVEIREPFSTLATFISGIPVDTTATSKLYEIDALTLLGSSSGSDGLSEDIVSARMHAHPFTEPMTRLNYVRARWFDPETGTFLSPDPMGYVDSSNLYAFAGGDPVNQRDPKGTAVAVGMTGTFVVSDERTGSGGTASGGTYRIPRSWAASNKTTMLQILVYVGGMSPTEAMNLMDAQGLTIAKQGPEALAAIALDMEVVDAALKQVLKIYAVTAVGIATGGATTAGLAAAGATTFTSTTVGAFVGGVAGQGTSDVVDQRFSGVDAYLTAGATSATVTWVFQSVGWLVRNVRLPNGGPPPFGGRYVFRTGSQTNRAYSDPTGVSTRGSISSSADKMQIFEPGEKIYAIDTRLLPEGSALADDIPAGHVSVNATPDQIRLAIVPHGPDNPLQQLGLKPLKDLGCYRLPK